MIRTLAVIWASGPLRLSAMSLFFLGIGIASLLPFQALIGVETLGFSDAAYAGILALDACLAVIGAVWVGLITDSWLDRRRMAIALACLACLASLLMVLAPGKASFVLAHGVAFPIAGALFAQTFALVRLASADLGPADQNAVLASVRGFLAIPFVLFLPIWSAVLADGTSLLIIYPVVLVVHASLLAAILAAWPSDSVAGWRTVKTDNSLLAGLRELLTLRVARAVLILGLINTGLPVYLATLGLTFEESAVRSRGDTAIFFAIVAGLELPILFGMAALLARVDRDRLIAFGGMAYASFLIGLPVLRDTGLVWLLTIPAALGGGIVLSLPIAYLQDMMADRPGAGGSLITVERIVSNGAAAALFAIGTSIAGYGLVAGLGGATVLAASLVFLMAAQKKPSPA